MKGKIFICYRREDSSWSTRLIHDKLLKYFPEEQLFIDVDSIAPGDDFVCYIEDAVRNCDVLLAVIGQKWLEVIQSKAAELDFVRLEISAALKSKVRVIPILVENTKMPLESDLPDELKPLARKNAFFVSLISFNSEIEILVQGLKKFFLQKETELKQEKQKQIEEEFKQKQIEEEEEKLIKEQLRLKRLEEKKQKRIEKEIRLKQAQERQQQKEEEEERKLKQNEQKQQVIINSKAETKVNPTTAVIKPEITYFKSDRTVLRNGGSYTLSWDVRDAENASLYKNDKLYKTFYGEKSITLKENYEGKQKKIQYNLIAAKDDVQTKSDAVIISVKPPLNIKRLLIIIGVPIIVIMLSVVLYKSFKPKPVIPPNNSDSTVTTMVADTAVAADATSIDSFTKAEIAPNTIVTITGKNIPVNDSSLKITFNGTAGKIESKSNDSINVLVPALPAETKISNIVVYYNLNAFTAANYVTYTQASTAIAIYPYRASNIYPDNYITISGNNLPATRGSIRVTFNDVDGVINQQTKKMIYVRVPAIDNTNGVKIMVYVNGKPFTAANYISYKNNDIIVDPISFNSVTANDIITVIGKNLPAIMWVQFNNVKGDVVSKTSSSIRVRVPSFSNAVKQVDIGICVNGNRTPVRAANNVPYRVKN